MSDTIAAIATPGQPSAIGILRLSGPNTCAALDAVFRAKNGRPAAQQRPGLPLARRIAGKHIGRQGRPVPVMLGDGQGPTQEP